MPCEMKPALPHQSTYVVKSTNVSMLLVVHYCNVLVGLADLFNATITCKE